jgi:ABC-type branched-subunit amino acid transport system ATPase component
MLTEVNNIIVLDKGRIITQGNLETISQEEQFMEIMGASLME